MVVGKALDLSYPVADLLPTDPEAAGQVGAEVSLKEIARRLGVVVDGRVVKAGPLAVRPLGGVGDQRVDMNLGISGARGAVAEACGEEAVALDELGICSAPRPARLTLKVVERSAQSAFGRGGDGGAGLPVAERPEQRGRLRDREGEIEAGDSASAADRTQAQRLARSRVAAGQHRGQLVGFDHPVQAELLCRVTEPLALGLALAGVVVLSAFGHLVEVVALLSYAELAYREHPPPLSNGKRFCPGQFQN